MRRKTRSWWIAAAIAFLPLSMMAQEADLPEDEAARMAAKALAQYFGDDVGSERMVVLSETPVTLPYTNHELTLFKLYDLKSGESRGVALDADSREVDYQALLDAENKARFEKIGSMHPELARQVEQRQAETIPVLIRLNVEEDEGVDKSKLDKKQLLEQATRSAKRDDSVADRARSAFQQAGAKYGFESQEPASLSGPFASARLTPKAISRLARDPQVLFIGLDGEKEIPDYPTIAESLPTTRTNYAHSRGFKGSGVKVAVLEGGNLTLPSACFRIGGTHDSGAASSSHFTKSVGIIANRYNAGACNGSWQGYAPAATVLLANGSGYTNRYEWAKSQGANVVTMSWHFGSEETSGSLHSRDVYFDYWVTRYPYPSMFASAGNQASSSAYSSGKGYNFFGVANILNDGDGNRCNDAISTSSSWKNPTSAHSDREIPEIASPGSRHELLGSSFGGTSAATPVTAGITAVLMSKNTSLKIWPEAIRAILLATANYQQGDGANWTKFSDGKDGTGLTNTQYAYWTAGRRETGTSAQFRAHDYGSMRNSDFSGGFFDKEWYARTMTTNSRIRVALTWNSKVSTSTSVLDADLDLWVYDPAGNLVATSTSWDGSYEFVEFTPNMTGNYRIRVRGYSVPNDLFSYWSVAWTTHYELCN